MDGEAASANEKTEAEPSSIFLQRDSWARLGAAPSAEAFAAAWLELQCRLIGAVRQGVVLLQLPRAEWLQPAAVWPERVELSANLTTVAELAASDKRGTVRNRESAGPGGKACAFPILVDEVLHGVVAVELEPDCGLDVRVVMRQLQWGSGWLESLVRRKHPGSRDQLIKVLDLLACALEQHRFQAAATALVTELDLALGCDRVSVGFLAGKHVRVAAISHSANFSKKASMVRAIAAAMDEAVEQQAAVRLPAPSDGLVLAVRAQEELAKAFGATSVLSVPLHEEGRCVGAITLERSGPDVFQEKEKALCEQLAAMAGPVLEAKRLNDRWLVSKIWDSAIETLRNLFGPRHVGLKLTAIVLIAVVFFLTFSTGMYRVSANATLEGTVRRVVTALMDGYVEEAFVRAGDIVSASEAMARLEDDELRLEQVRWLSQKAQLQQQYKEAFAEHDRAQVRVLRAQLQQAEARLALLDEQLARVLITAPFDGIIVSGDLSQSLGSPVERGQILFEVAPLDSYRVVLQVDERDISQIEAGQQGHLVLAALPREPFAFRVETVTPVAQAEEGINVFRVEGLLDATDVRMRPGMEGVAKVDIEERRLIWIWTHKLWSWLRMQFWTWWPHA